MGLLVCSMVATGRVAKWSVVVRAVVLVSHPA
jgi:hypothetical protein